MSLTATHEVSKWDWVCRGGEEGAEKESWFLVSLDVRFSEITEGKDVLFFKHEGHVRGIPFLLYFEE